MLPKKINCLNYGFIWQSGNIGWRFFKGACYLNNNSDPKLVIFFYFKF